MAIAALRAVEDLLEREIGGDTLSPDPLAERIKNNVRRTLEERDATRQAAQMRRRSRMTSVQSKEAPVPIVQETKGPDL